MEQTKNLDFTTLAPKQRDVVLPGEYFNERKDQPHQCILREVTSDGAKQYINAYIASVKVDDAGRMVGFSNAGEIEPLLVHLSLYERDGGGNLRNVPKSVIAALPGGWIKQLAETARELSKDALRQDKPDRAKLINAAVDLLSEIAGVQVPEDDKKFATMFVEEVAARFTDKYAEKQDLKKS